MYNAESKVPVREEKWLNVLPDIPAIGIVNFCDKLPCLGGVPKPSPVVALGLERKELAECFFVKEKDLAILPLDKNPGGSLKSDLSPEEFKRGVDTFYKAVFFCKNEAGLTVGVLPGETLPPVFLPVTGEFLPLVEMADKHYADPHSSVYTDEKAVAGLINPAHRGGALDLLNHAFTDEEKQFFLDIDPETEPHAAMSNFVRMSRWINGRRVDGIGNREPIKGGENGTFLYWNYAQPTEYIRSNPDYDPKKGCADFKNILLEMPAKDLLLFDMRPEHSGAVIELSKYQLKTFSIRLVTNYLALTAGAVFVWRLVYRSENESLTLRSPYSDQVIKVPCRLLQEFVAQHPEQRELSIKEPRPEMARGLSRYGSFTPGTPPSAPTLTAPLLPVPAVADSEESTDDCNCCPTM
ncbi:hypothetical protein BH10PSE19_BH10PSE19_12760 [soil metagenome]